MLNLPVDKKLVIVDFWTPWCAPCKMLSPILANLEHENPELGVVKINGEENHELVVKYSISSVPTLIFFQNEKEVERMVGMRSQSKIQEKIDEYITP